MHHASTLSTSASASDGDDNKTVREQFLLALHFSAQQVALGVHYSMELGLTLTAPVKPFHVSRLNSHMTACRSVASFADI
jgi:hypothetical protein